MPELINRAPSFLRGPCCTMVMFHGWPARIMEHGIKACGKVACACVPDAQPHYPAPHTYRKVTLTLCVGARQPRLPHLWLLAFYK